MNMNSHRKILFHTISYLLMGSFLMAANHHTPDNDIAEGKKIYHDRCKVCHGDHGDGKTFAANALYPSPKNFTAKESKEELTRERMIRSVTKGRPKTAMMPWKNVLTEQEISSVVSYIRQELMRVQEPQINTDERR